MNDLVVLVADNDMKRGINSLLSRHGDLGIRQISYSIFVNSKGHDSGIYRDAAEILRNSSKEYRYALVFIDHEGSGKEKETPQKIAEDIKSRLNGSGWKDRSEVIVFDPELEIWLWANSQYTAETLGWNNYPELRNWLVDKGFWKKDSPKPSRPKESLQEALKHAQKQHKGIPRSSDIHGEIASRIDFRECKDLSFRKFRETIQKWFCEST
jgi:hypothetical protein